jgi:hypothetical protein
MLLVQLDATAVRAYVAAFVCLVLVGIASRYE